MKNNNINVLIFFSFLLIISLNSCEEDTVKLEHEEDVVVNKENLLGAVRLTKDKIPALEGYSLKYCEYKPSVMYKQKGDTVSYTVNFRYRWTHSDTGIIDVNLLVANSNELAYEFYMESRNLMNIGREIPDDEPAIAGDNSYDKGSAFVRNNMYVKIYASGEFYAKMKNLAQQIDRVIIEETNFLSLTQVQPVIKVFNLEENPLFHGTKTFINLEVEDPNNTKLYCRWETKSLSGNTGWVNREFQAFSFEASQIYDELLTNQQELTVMVINEYGFIADSTILVTSYKD